MEKSSVSYKLGVVLSGGGMRGLAHAGILQAFDEAGISPDVFSGASAGSIVSALYAKGHSPKEIKSFFEINDLFSYRSFSLGKAGILRTDPFRSYLEPFLPEDSFDSLGRPVYITATDILSGKPRVFQSGELIQPILASCAIPGIFAPVEYQGDFLGDGGIYSNLPTEPLEGKCEILIGIYVHPLEKIQMSDLKNPLDVLSRAYDISRSAAIQPKFAMCDYVIVPQGIEPYGVFDSDHVDEMFEAGVEAGKKAVEEIKALLSQA